MPEKRLLIRRNLVTTILSLGSPPPSNDSQDTKMWLPRVVEALAQKVGGAEKALSVFATLTAEPRDAKSPQKTLMSEFLLTAKLHAPFETRA